MNLCSRSLNPNPNLVTPTRTPTLTLTLILTLTQTQIRTRDTQTPTRTPTRTLTSTRPTRPLCTSSASVFGDSVSEYAAIGAVLQFHTAPPPPAAGPWLEPTPAPTARAASRADTADRLPAAMSPSSLATMLQPHTPALTVPPSSICAPPTLHLNNLHTNPHPNQVLQSAFTTGYPYCENKGWFAFNESGRVRSLLERYSNPSPIPNPMSNQGILFLERLFLMLSMPQQPLVKHPGKRMCDSIRWMDRATADAHGVPASAVGFEY